MEMFLSENFNQLCSYVAKGDSYNVFCNWAINYFAATHVLKVILKLDSTPMWSDMLMP